MILRRAFTLSALAALFASLASLAGAETIVPVAYVELIQSDGSPAGEYLVIDSFDPETGPLFTAGLLEAPGGHRLLQTDRMDRDNGLRIQRLEDLGSGWWAELELDFGFKNLGSPLDYADPMEWSMAARDRARSERATTTYTIRFSDGRSARWTKPYGEAAEGEKNREAALVDLAASLTEAKLPDSTVTALETLATLQASDNHPELAADKLFGFLWLAYSAATETSAKPGASERSFTVRKTEHDPGRLLKIIQKNTRPAHNQR